MCSKVLNCDPHQTDKWKNYTNLKNLHHIRKDIKGGDYVLTKIKSINQQVTFTPILKVQGMAKGYDDVIYVFPKIWRDLGGKNTQVKLQYPNVHLAWLRYYFLRLRYDEKFTIGIISLLIGFVSSTLPIIFPYNYVITAIAFVVGIIQLFRA